MKLTRCHFYMIILLLFALPFSSIADVMRSGTDGFTPPDAARGAVTGSYPLEGLDTVNLFNRTVNFELPLATLQGRGSVAANYTLTINRGFVGVYNESAEQSSYSINMYIPSGPVAKLTSQQIVHPTYESLPCPLGTFPTWLTTRFKFTMPDGSERIFHDVAQNGAAFKINNLCSGMPTNNRGRVFITSDATAATLIVDSDVIDRYVPVSYTENNSSGVVILRDGTRYRFSGGRLVWIQDRNGNRVTYGWNGPNPDRPSSITDSIGRKIEIIEGAPAGGYTVRTKGFNGALRDVKVYKAPLSAALRQGSTPKTYGELFPETGDTYGTTPFSDDVVSRVELPNGKSYFFYYNAYAELARVILPTGGGYDYEYPPVGESGFEPLTLIADRPMSKRTVYHTLDAGTDPNNPPSANVVRKELYSREDINGERIITVETHDGSNALLAKNKHYFYDHPPSGCIDPFKYAAWWKGKEHKTEYFQINGGVAGPALRTVEHTWDPLPALGVPPCEFAIVTPWPNPKIVEIKTTIEGNLISKETYGYDSYHNLADAYQYNFGVGAPGPLTRRTHIDYLRNNPYQGNVDYATDLNIHIRILPTYTSVSDGNGVEISKTWFDYDAYGINGLPVLQDCPGISQHDGGFHTGYGARGNLLKMTRLATSAPTYVTQHFFYDIAGNVVQKTDGFGTPIMFDYRDNFGSPDDPAVQSSGNPANNAPGELGGQISYAFPFKITNALQHKAYTKYDYYLGRATLSEDPNGVKSNIYFNDALDRPTRGVRAIGTAVAGQTVFVYNDSDSPVNGYPARSTTTISDKDVFGESDSGNGLKSVALYDGLGRPFRGAAYEGSTTWTIKDRRFDARGRVSQVSNPYRATDPGSASPPAGLWTTTEYDALGRVIKVTTPDAATVNTEYSGNRVLVIDQAGKKRISQTDALGRLTDIWEVRSPDAASGTVSVSFPNHPEITAGYQTNYFYDPLDNLRAVSQGAQGRWFSYDSLSRLIRVRNLEQNCNPNLPPHTDPFTGGYCWSTAYSYDANSNLTQRIDARGIETKYYYDALSRNIVIE
jgi:YD repeat-containing protein